MSQQVISLENASLSEMAITEQHSSPNHVCEGPVCTMVRECDWLRRWREEQEDARAEVRRAS